MTSEAVSVLLVLLFCCYTKTFVLNDVQQSVGNHEGDDNVLTKRDSFAEAVVNTQTFSILNYQGDQIYIYAAITNENENKLEPHKWAFFYVPVTAPERPTNNNEKWIWQVKSEIRMKIILGNDDIRERVRQEVMNKYTIDTNFYSRYWTVAPLMVDALTAFIVLGSNSPVAGVHPYRVLHPTALTIIFRFQCSMEETAREIMEKVEDGDYEVQASYYFAGFKQVSTNFISISGDQLKSVLSKTTADGGNTNAQYIHRNQGTKFISTYLTNVKKMIYMESANANMSVLSAGLEEQFISLFQQAMGNSKETQLEAKLYDQVWSSSDLNPDRISSEMQSVFTYNETETKRHNYSDSYFDFDRKQAQSTTSSGSGGLNFAYKVLSLGLFGGGSTSSSSAQSEHNTTHIVTSAKDIQHYLEQQSVETEWTGEKWIPKSFKLFKVTDISDRLQVAVLAKQLITEKSNGAMLRTISTLNSPPSSLQTSLRDSLTGEIRLYSGRNQPPLPWLLCDGRAISRIEYQRLFAVIGEDYGVGDEKTTFNLPDFRGRVPVGVDELEVQAGHARSPGSVGGQAMHRLILEELPAHKHEKGTIDLSMDGQHSHSINDRGHTHSYTTWEISSVSGTGHEVQSGRGVSYKVDRKETVSSSANIQILAAGNHTHILSGETASVGIGQQFSLMQPFQAVNYIISSD